MKNFRLRAKRVRRRKVAASAAYSRHFTVNNCTIPKSEVEWKTISFKGNVIFKDDSWKNPEKGCPQHKSMMKKHTEWIYNKETHITEKVTVASTFPDAHYVEKFWWKNLPAAEKWEAYAQDKLKKWEKKHPKPCKDDDLFKEEFIPMWEGQRVKALERIRDFVVSVYDKLPLTGRFKQAENKFSEEKVADIKDINGEGHHLNDLDPEKSKLLNKAKKVTNKVHAKRDNLVCTNLKDHKRKNGRIILPDYKMAA